MSVDFSSGDDQHIFPNVGDAVRWLREQLSNYPERNDIERFAGRPMPKGGMSFFPSDLGLYDPNRATISTIVLGSDWGNTKSFEEELAAETALWNTTVANTDKKLRAAGFDLQDCMYSNAWPVMRKGIVTETKHHDMRDDRAFTDEYRNFLRLCIRTLKPKLIVAMGKSPTWFVGPMVGPAWAGATLASYRHLAANAMCAEPMFGEGGCVYVSITHPSNPQNEKHRTFLSGDLNEIDLLKRARLMARIGI